MSTFFLKKEDIKDKKWHVIDAKDQVVGRLASKISMILMGKDKPSYTPHVESGDGVIVINAAKVRVTGRKNLQKVYKNYSGFPGGIRERSFERVMKDDPTFALTNAVKGMLPKNRLGSRMLTHFLVYAGAEHPHIAQKPVTLNVEKAKK